MDNKNTNKVVILPEDQTKLLREELEDLIIQANMLLQNKDFNKIKDLLENANTIITKIEELKTELNSTQENFTDILFFLQNNLLKKLEKTEKVAESLKQQYNRLKGDIDSIIATNIGQIDSKIEKRLFDGLDVFVKKAKVRLARKVKEFDEELNVAIERARENFNFFKQNEIDRTLEEIRAERKRGSFVFKLALLFFLISAGLNVFVVLKLNKLDKIVSYNAYVLQKIDNQ